MKNAKETMTVTAAAKALQCCSSAVRKAVRAGKLRATYSKLTPGRIRGILCADVEKLLAKAKKIDGGK